MVSGQWRGVVSSRGHMSGVASAGQWGVTSSGGVNGQHMSVVTSVTRDTRGAGDWSASCALSLVSPSLPLDRRFYKFAETEREIVTKPRAQSGHTRRQSETGIE